MGLAVLLAVASGYQAAADTAPIRRDGTRWIIGNAAVERVVETKPFLHTTQVTNKMVEPARAHPVESRGFVLSLDNGALTLTSADFAVQSPEVKKDDKGARLVVPLRCEEHGLDVTVVYQIGRGRFGPGGFYFRKHLEIDPGKHLLNRIDVESFRLPGLELQRFDTQPMPYPMVPWDIRVGRPMFAGREFFLGVEHPASYNVLDEQQWIALRQHPGRKGKVVSSPAVIGLCPDRPRERVLDYFERYVNENRARPVKRTVQWIAYFNVWMDDDACREKIDVAERVFRRRGAPLDVVLMDSGWTDPKSIMAISPKEPKRLALMQKLVEQRLGAKLGLHVITSGVKTLVDKDWLAAEGYDLIYHKDRRHGAYCFADPRVFTVFRDNLVDYIRRYDVSAYKFDWGHFACGKAGHRGHLPGMEYGLEAGATNFARTHRAFRQANPDVFLFNTGWYSPWWLWSYDAVFAAGGDYNFGLHGPPSFSTASLLCTWRDAIVRGNLVRWSPYFPLDSLMMHDPISYWWHQWDVHSESPLRPFTDYLVTAWLRGSQMAEIGNNISAWDDAHADAAVAVLKWMKANDDVILASTRYIGGDPFRGEPYGYAHFTRENRGIIIVRNPTIEQREIEIPFDETAGMWPGEKEYVVRGVYPFTCTFPEVVRYGSRFKLGLDGHEVCVLEIWPLDALPEPMPICCCRYQVVEREPGTTTFRFAERPERLELFSPVKPVDAEPIAGQPRRYVIEPPGVTAGLSSSALGTTCPSPSVDMIDGCYVVKVDVAEGCRGRVILLFRQRGIQGKFTLDGKPVEADAPHIRLADAAGRKQGARAKAPDWSLFGVNVAAGKHELRFEPQQTADQIEKHPWTVGLDVRKKVVPIYTLRISHPPIKRTTEALLPQNWAWEKRADLWSSFIPAEEPPVKSGAISQESPARDE
jgi:hypothetical protein